MSAWDSLNFIATGFDLPHYDAVCTLGAWVPLRGLRCLPTCLPTCQPPACHASSVHYGEKLATRPCSAVRASQDQARPGCQGSAPLGFVPAWFRFRPTNQTSNKHGDLTLLPPSTSLGNSLTPASLPPRRPFKQRAPARLLPVSRHHSSPPHLFSLRPTSRSRSTNVSPNETSDMSAALASISGTT